MARAAALLAASALLALVLALAARGADAGVEVPLSWELGADDAAAAAEDGFGFGGADQGAVVRRVLQGGGYISYGALRRDNVPCSVRGASYYNCRPGAQGNPYSRGCSAITRCRG
ncbi:rapid alkalinization factor 23 [Brachypodium distachyon]|uniref:Rapid alkalinization factor 1 n=1 Tax=Brachypodium distachyon TaxID=15368 RepID=I1HF90_BRADI|nr:rapid alkalinization factor 23 [Brachypodium distachyon]KQK04278.1 hypothetical protein BRADI_2g12770v3 [Brachypodium distachyon]|eukprot:XP_003567676.1 rapid alkalinization factor 23 [Brachypodium distachyon]